MASIDKPTQQDVLCGRGITPFSHTGNHYFRHLVVEHASSYRLASRKKQKTQVVMLVARIIIDRGGRFLIRDNDVWKNGGMRQGRKKAGQALRDALRGRMSCVELNIIKTQAKMNGEMIRANNAPTEQFSELASTYSTALRGRISCLEQSMLKNQAGSEVVRATSQAHASTQIRDLTLKTNDFPPLPLIYSTVEPSNSWMTATMDAELVTYLRNLFFLSKNTE